MAKGSAPRLIVLWEPVIELTGGRIAPDAVAARTEETPVTNRGAFGKAIRCIRRYRR